ncbi:DUF4956 domain-containing protein [Candidatus Woesearchaeota archaeon]|jgi:uncharacterized membrane protein YhiD involved in acid resistance|nr:DUF4956 domain-containing protein [Candidatus Woesearchaeota archaeon]
MTEVGEFINMEKMSHIYDPIEILINLGASFILGMIVSIVYKFTHKGLSYSQSFMITNIFIAIIVSMVIMVIGNNLARAFALVGALSIIRFRTVVKDTKDTAYIFWALASGLAAGTGNYFLAVSGSAIISMVAYILYITDYGSVHKSEFILQFRVKREKTDQSQEELNPDYISLISKYSRISTLLHVESSGDGKSLKVSYDIVMKKEEGIDKFISSINAIEGIDEVTIVAAKNDIDY